MGDQPSKSAPVGSGSVDRCFDLPAITPWSTHETRSTNPPFTMWRPVPAAFVVVVLLLKVGSIQASPSSQTKPLRLQPLLATSRLVGPNYKDSPVEVCRQRRWTTSSALLGRVLGVRGGGSTWALMPSAAAAARVANVFFWITGLTSAADGVKAWVDVGIQVPRGSLAEWSSERHGYVCSPGNSIGATGRLPAASLFVSLTSPFAGAHRWILLSLSTLLLLVERSSLTVPQMVVVSYIPMMYHMFQGLYSGRVNSFNLQSGDAFLLVYHAVLLVAVLGCSVALPTTWLLDGLWWFAGIGAIVAPKQMMHNANLDVAKTTFADRLLFVFQGHAALVYASALRAALRSSSSSSSAVPTLVSVVQGALLGWVVAIAVFTVQRIELGRSAGLTDVGRYALTGLAAVLTLLVHRGSYGIP